MEKVVFYKNKSLWAFILLISAMLIYLLEINFLPDGMQPGAWIGALIGSTIRFFAVKDNKREIYFVWLFCLVMILNYILFRYNFIYIPNYILVFIAISVFFIHEIKKKESKYQIHKIALVVILLVGFFSVDYYQNSSNIIKDRNFRRLIKKEYGIKGRIEKEDLRGIEKLFIESNSHINNIEGIEYFKDVTRLYISSGQKIKDFKPIAQMSNLKDLTIWYANVDKLEEIPRMESLEYLEILYPTAGKIDSLENFPNLEEFEVQGMDLDNLMGLKGPYDLEILNIAVATINTFDGIDKFPHVKKLEFYKLDIKDCSKIFDLKELESIKLRGGNIHNMNYFNKMTKERGIDVERSKPVDLRL